MIIDRHRAELGQRVWAFVDGKPTEVTFQGLAPYHGFHVGDIYMGGDPVSSDALFADNKADLIAEAVGRLRLKIHTLESEIAVLQEQNP